MRVVSYWLKTYGQIWLQTGSGREKPLKNNSNTNLLLPQEKQKL